MHQIDIIRLIYLVSSDLGLLALEAFTSHFYSPYIFVFSLLFSYLLFVLYLYKIKRYVMFENLIHKYNKKNVESNTHDNLSYGDD